MHVGSPDSCLCDIDDVFGFCVFPLLVFSLSNTRVESLPDGWSTPAMIYETAPQI
jgi:hypothetical protein